MPRLHMLRFLLPFSEHPGSFCLWDKKGLPKEPGDSIYATLGLRAANAEDLGSERDTDEKPYEKRLEFFLSPLRPLFSLEHRNERSCTILVPTGEGSGLPRRSVIYLFPKRIGVLVFEGDPEEPWTANRLKEQANEGVKVLGELGKLGEGKVKLDPVGTERRCYTFALLLVSHRKGRALRKVCWEYTEHSVWSADAYRPKALDCLFERQGIQEWKRWSALLHRDNFCLAYRSEDETGAPDLERDEVACNSLQRARGDFFRLYLFALFQKLSLLQMMSSILGPEAPAAGGAPGTTDSGALLNFRNRFWFQEVARNTTGRHLYRQFRTGLGLAELFEDVKEEVQILEDRRDSRLNKQIQLATALLLPVALTSGLLGMNVRFGAKDVMTWGEFWPRFGGLSLLLLAGLVFLATCGDKIWDWLWQRFHARRR